MPTKKQRPPMWSAGAIHNGPWGLMESLKRTDSTHAAENILARLDKVRPSGDGRWLARCPAHDDRFPSLSIRETSGGVLLVHCFAGCSAADVVAAIGLELADLFPEKLELSPLARRERRHQHAAREALRSLRHDAIVVAIVAEMVKRGQPLDAGDRVRMWEAATRIRAAAETVGAS